MINAPLPTPIPIAIQPHHQGMHARTLPIPFKFEPLAVPLLNIENNNNVDRKRKRILDPVAAETTVKLSRDELLKFSSKEYEDYVRNISRDKPLSPTEQREVKRQRRLIKNREYAQTSRNKKKEQVGLMEIQLQQLTNENDSLTAQVSALNTMVLQLEQTNLSLVQENNQLKEIIANGFSSPPPPHVPETIPPFPTSPSIHSPTCSTDDSSEVDLFMPSLTTSSDSEDSTSPTEPIPSLYDSDVLDVDPFSGSFGWSTSNVFTLFIVLFSFGIFFNGLNLDSNPSFVPMDMPVPPNPKEVCEMDPIIEKTSFRGLLEYSSFGEVDEVHDVHDIFPSNTTCPAPISMFDVLNDEISFKKSSFSENHKFSNNNTEQPYLPVSFTTTVLVEV